MVLLNGSDGPVDLDGWFICQRPSYWPLPAVTLDPAQRITIRTASGEDTDEMLFAGGRFGQLSGGGGEVALYRDSAFDNPGSIVGYVAWNSGGARQEVAQAAGIWGGRNVLAGEGDVIAFTGAGTGADAYEVEARGS